MNLICLTCQGMKRTDSFAEMERNMYDEKADNINKLLGGVDNRSWSGNLVARSNDNSDKEKNSTNNTTTTTTTTTTASKNPINSARRVPLHCSGPLTKTATTKAAATSFNRSSSVYRRAPVHRSGPLNRTHTSTATRTRLFGADTTSASHRLQVHCSSGPINLEERTSKTGPTTPTGPPKLVRSGGMRRDWSFEDLRQMNSLKT